MRAVDAVLVELLDEHDLLEESKARIRKLWRKLGESLRYERQLCGLSLRECAARIGVSAAFLSGVELGRRPLTAQRIKSLRSVLLNGPATRRARA